MKHLAIALHKQKAAERVASTVKKRKLQVAVSEIFDLQTDRVHTRKAELIRLVKVFSGVNIPLHVFDRPSFRGYMGAINNNIGVIPSAHHLRQVYLSKTLEIR